MAIHIAFIQIETENILIGYFHFNTNSMFVLAQNGYFRHENNEHFVEFFSVLNMDF